ncbi:MAG: lipid A deacylase LpxR family protein [Pseudomonadota bacterium]
MGASQPRCSSVFIRVFTVISALGASHSIDNDARADDTIIDVADRAAISFADDEDYTVTLVDENDRWGFDGGDRWYTRGGVIHVLLPAGKTPWLDDVPLMMSSAEGRTAPRLSLSFGQEIFTPENLGATAPIADDRPYGAFLYLGAEAIRYTPHVVDGGWSTLIEDRRGLQIGILGGSASLGEFAQSTTHTLYDSTSPEGWDNGLDNEPALNLTASRAYRFFDTLGPVETEVKPYGAVSLGTVYTHAAAGLEMRIGDDLADDLSQNHRLTAVPGSSYSRPSDGFAWSLFGGLHGRAVGYNAFLDGNLLADGPDPAIDIDKQPFVLDAQLGFALMTGRVRFSYAYTWRSKEFEEQPEAQSFGTFTLGARF